MTKFIFDIEEFKKDYNNNVCIDDLMIKYGYKNKSTFYRLTKKLGLLPRTNRWTKEKLEILKQDYPNSDWDDILQLLYPFRKEDIIAKAYKLKIKRECFGYSIEDEIFLKENYTTFSIEELGVKLNKTPGSIMTKANKMGLVKVEKWTEEEMQKLIEMYPYYTNEELIEYFPNRTIIGISSMATMKLNLKKDEEFLREKYYKLEKEKALENLRNFAEKLGRTPTGREVQNNSDLIGIASYHRYFGSYANACQLVGLEVNASLFGKSFHLESKNGDICYSKKEKIITDLLIENKINYKKEVLYKDIIKKYDIKNIRCDWLLNDEIIVEYFGMSEKDYYKERMDEKISLCENYGLKLISLERKDTYSNFNGLLNKFSQYGINLIV